MVAREEEERMLGFFIVSVMVNVMFILLLWSMKARKQQEEKNRNELRELAEKLLEKQIQQLGDGNSFHTSIEVEIARFIKDYVLYALVKGVRQRGKRFAGRILKQYPKLIKLFEE